MNRPVTWALAAVVALLAGSPEAQARINVVSLPGRDAVQLTIYNSVDLTLVKEKRLLTFRRGLNRLEFSWANTLIDPTSVEFQALTHADEVEVLDLSFPPRVANTLEWRISSELAGEVEVEIRYFTSGIKWTADYVAEATTSEDFMDLAGYVRVDNKSGEDYENSQVRLVVGVVRLVEEIAQLGRAGKPTSMSGTEALKDFDKRTDVYFNFYGAFGGGGGMPVQKKEIVKEGLSEYFLYTVEGQDTIPNGWSKRLPSFSGTKVPITSYYKYEKERWGEQVVRYYKFTNSVPSKLGKEPLPDGEVKAFRLVNEDGLYAFVGRTAVKYIPVNEAVEMELGQDREVLVEPKLMNWEKTNIQFDNNGDVKGWTVKETWEVEVQNSKGIGVVVDVRRNFAGDWVIKSDTTYEKVDATKVKFALPLKPKAKQVFTYEVTMNFGTNVRR